MDLENEVVDVAKWRMIRKFGKRFVNEAETADSKGYASICKHLG